MMTNLLARAVCAVGVTACLVSMFIVLLAAVAAGIREPARRRYEQVDRPEVRRAGQGR